MAIRGWRMGDPMRAQGGHRRGGHRRASVPRHCRGPGVPVRHWARGHLPHHPQGGDHPDPGALRLCLGGHRRPGLKGRGPASRGRTLLGVPGTVLAARARLKALNPHLVLGMGGHASGPVGVAAWLLGIPLALHEQNAIPGATNR